MIRFEFRIDHECVLSGLSRAFPEVPFSLYGSSQTGYLELGTADSEVIRRIRAGYSRLARVDPARVPSLISPRGPPALLVRISPPRKRSISDILDRNASVMLYPVEFLGGGETYRAIVLEDRRFPRIVAQLRERGRVDVLRKCIVRTPVSPSSMLISWDEALSALTNRQKIAMLRAIERGYYEMPRRVEITDVADGTGLSRTTYGYHMRRAESKLLNALVPYLRRSLQQAIR